MTQRDDAAAKREPLLAHAHHRDAASQQHVATNRGTSPALAAANCDVEEDAATAAAASPLPAHLAAWGEGLGTETRRVLALAGPTVASSLLSFASYLITTAQAGHLGAQQLSGFTLARTIFHITGLSLVVGLGAGTDTFSGQAFGAGQVKLVGIYLQRASTISVLVALPLLAAWWWRAEEMMLLLGQTPDVVPLASQLLRLMSPALVVWAVLQPMHSYLSSQGQMVILTVLAAVGVVSTLVVNWLFISALGYGIQGVAMAYVVLAFTELLAMVACMVWVHYQQPAGGKTWQGLDLRAAFSEWIPYLRIALPSMAMICLDWWFFEVVILVVGLQHEDADVQLGAMGVMFATHSLAFMVAGGFGQAAATRTANELGAGHGAAAKRATVVSNISGLITALPIAAGLYLFRQPWAALFASDPQVIATVVDCMFYLTLSIIADSINAVMSGVLRGCGHQLIGFLVNLGTFWLVGLPLAYKVAIVGGLGAQGIWMVLAGASLLQASVVVIVAATFNWDLLARQALLLLAAGRGVSEQEVSGPAGGVGGHHGVFEPLLGSAHA